MSEEEECPRSSSVECVPHYRPRFSDEEAIPRPLRLLRPEECRLRRH